MQAECAEGRKHDMKSYFHDLGFTLMLIMVSIQASVVLSV